MDDDVTKKGVLFICQLLFKVGGSMKNFFVVFSIILMIFSFLKPQVSLAFQDNELFNELNGQEINSLITVQPDEFGENQFIPYPDQESSEIRPFGEIFYDDGTMEVARYFRYGGSRRAVKMSLPSGLKSAIVSEATFFFNDKSKSDFKGTHFAIEVWSEGVDGLPDQRIAGPINATGIRDGVRWTTVDLQNENIIVSGDFFLVLFQKYDAEESVYLGYDTNSPNSERNYQQINGIWGIAPKDHGNAMIRAKIGVTQDHVIDRIYGDSRISTAIEISKSGWNRAKTVILARSDDFADALAGVPLAYQLNAPILLTRSNEIPKEVIYEIQRLGAGSVTILGGENAISENVEQTLKDMRIFVSRISGPTRYDTAAEIARTLKPHGSTYFIVANGLDFPDALSVAPYAAREGIPILLTRNNMVPPATRNVIDELKSYSSQTFVIGGNGVVLENLLSILPDARRISGTNRYGTNVAVANWFGGHTEHMYVATGLHYADALTGAVLAAKNNSGLLLVRNHNVPTEISNFLSNPRTKFLTIFGGPGAVNDQVKSDLFNLLYP